MTTMPNTAALNIKRLNELVADARRIVAFTGAGISTESGIPDFRSPGGQWSKTMPIYFDEFCRDAEARAEAWRRKFEMEPFFEKAEPSLAHTFLRELHASGRLDCVITQNIDNLHQKSGLPDSAIIELHGNGSYAHCLTCSKTYTLEWVRERFFPKHTPPDCPDCGGFVKAATVSFGQAMPEEAMDAAQAAADSCDLFLTMGSSLVVFPAAGLPLLAKRAGATLAIINREATELDAFADVVCHGELKDILGIVSL